MNSVSTVTKSASAKRVQSAASDAVSVMRG